MTRKSFLTFASLVALSIGAIAMFLPSTLIIDMKDAAPSGTTIVMARTVGVLLISFGVLNFLVRSEPSSPTLKHILLANALLQLLILPIDPLAYAYGVYGSLMSFVPNTILHIALFCGFVFFWLRIEKSRPPVSQ